MQVSGNFGFGRFGPIIDGYVIPTDILEALSKGTFNDVPMIAGWVTGDGALMGNPSTDKDKYEKQAKEKYGEKAAEYMKLWPGSTSDEAVSSLKEINLLQFAAFPAHLLAGYLKSKTFLYQYSHVPVDKPGFPNYGAFHTSEVPFALHTLNKWQRPWRPIDYEVENIMSTYWMNFVATGNPNGNNLPEWKSYEKNTGIILDIGDQTIAYPALFRKKFEFLEDLMNRAK